MKKKMKTVLDFAKPIAHYIRVTKIKNESH